MSVLFSYMWGIIGFIFMIAGKPFIEVAACFLLCSLFMGVAELHEIRRWPNNFRVNLKLIRTDGDAEEMIHVMSGEDSDGN